MNLDILLFKLDLLLQNVSICSIIDLLLEKVGENVNLNILTIKQMEILNQMSFPEFDLPMNLKTLWVEAIDFSGTANITKEIHSHSFCEVHFVLAGKVTYYLDNNIFEIEGNKAFFIPANKSHKFENCTENIFKIAIAFSFEANFLKEATKIDFNEETTKNLNKIFTLCEEDNIFTSHIIGCKTIEILYSVLTNLQTDLPKSTEAKQDSRFLVAKSFIENNINKKITSSHVANECCLSPKQMNRIFIKETGKNVSNYINAVKIKKAKRLLLESNLSIKEISFILGFENEGSFILFFKKHCSTTPGSFRKNVQ